MFLAILAANALRHGVPFLSRDRLLTVFGATASWVLVGVGLAGLVWAVCRRFEVLLRGITAALVALSPLIVVTTVGALVGAARSQTRLRDQSPLPMASGVPERRVVLLIFDELDQRIAFDQREAGFGLPQIDALRSQSIEAARAYPPSNGTRTSIPALLTGLPVSEARWGGPSDSSSRSAENPTSGVGARHPTCSPTCTRGA